jgi:ornithine decarboxylase
MASRFNGYGYYDEVILEDEPMLSMYADQSEDQAVSAAV